MVKNNWCCNSHSVSRAYGELLFDCLDMGKPGTFRYFLEKYWLKQPEETWRELARAGKSKIQLPGQKRNLPGVRGLVRKGVALKWKVIILRWI